MQQNNYAEVILPLPIRDTYTFGVPADLDPIVPGSRVEVQFGSRKRYTGIVSELHNRQQKDLQIKPILTVLDSKPVVSALQLRFWRALADYYLCKIGEIMNVAVPAGIKLSSETWFVYNAELDELPADLSEPEYLMATALQQQMEMGYNEVQDLFGKKSIQPLIKSLLDRKIIFIREELKHTYKPKTQNFVQPLFEITNTALDTVFERVNKAPRQAEVILAMIPWIKQGLHISTRMLGEKIPNVMPVLHAMEKKGLLKVEQRQISRLDLPEEWELSEIKLSEAQLIAYNQIYAGFEKHSAILLHGVTGSGKTMVYIKLIEDVIARGGQVLLMVPEIALTTQLTRRIQKYFGDHAGTYHSSVGNDYKVEIWKAVSKGKSLVISARSGIFLPFNNLQLIILDEEHEYSYKQNDPAPRYHARESALILSNLTGCKVLFGSATPSIETYYQATRGKYGLVVLSDRYGNASLPEVRLIDRKLIANNKQKGSHFTPTLVNEMMLTLAHHKQSIIFQNRRGFSPVLTCSHCGWTKRCINCDVSMPYHKYNNSFMCHYCGWSDPADPACPACGNVDLTHVGFGTEKIEEELKILFPESEIARMDLDTVKGKRALADMIFRLETGQIDILVGTQLVSKGLNFEQVELVGIISADQLVRYPDFRTGERAFQLMVQVSGRSGRASEVGKVYIQYEKINPRLLAQIVQTDYVGFFNDTLEERRKFAYPPFCRLIRLKFRHKNAALVSAAAEWFAALLRSHWGSRVIGPAPGLIPRIRNYYIYELLLKLERKQAVILEIKQQILDLQHQLMIHPEFKRVELSIDVDPV